MKHAVGVTLATIRYTKRDGQKRIYQYWKARIYRNGKQINLGMFKKRADAVAAYEAAASRLHSLLTARASDAETA